MYFVSGNKTFCGLFEFSLAVVRTKMILLVVLGLTTVLGVRSEYNCSAGPPPCLDIDIVPREYDREYSYSNNPLPSEVFLKGVCPGVIEFLECARENEILPCLTDIAESLDLVALYNSANELCNEESDLRKGYAAHVDCVNNINFTAQACLHSVQETREQLEDTLREKEVVERYCLYIDVFKPCAIEIADNSCGKEAGQTADAIISRIENILRCHDDAEGFAEILADLNSRIENVV